MKIKNAPLRVLSVQEQQIMLTVLSAEMDLTRLGIYICLFTGIRIGELRALTWDDISLENNMIHIHTEQCNVFRRHLVRRKRPY